ncbi:hypothetical protein F4820DRAFT_236514 [Hypoxylon rubiginosum]|uniref:Uncharacterized protein n=1 Tax=Hypoxylon rubiginosum TaxID=110542 RepID=A0ACB9YGZ7_9PEZI|nr:hypothetical protein F4820DRAFT_236514 [Hypoxylon rubiginosum]
MEPSRIVAFPLGHPETPPELNIVVVGDFTKDGTHTKPSLSWVNSIIPPDSASIQILRLEFRISLHGASIWRQLSEKGDELLFNLQSEAPRFQIFQKPVIFVGYGLGGIVVK